MIAVSLELNRLKRLFAKLGIDWDWYTAGDYKSSFHSYYTDTTTAAQEEVLRSLVEESYRLLVEAIGEGRGISQEKMLGIANGRVYMHEEAVNLGLIDAVGWEDEAREALGQLTGAREPRETRTTSLSRRKYWNERWKPAPVVAVVGAYGSIRSGKSKQDFFRGGRTMGSRTVVNQLKAASRYPDVRAIVFRVDSGGGSALASDEILKEIRRIQREIEIPVIISMSNVAGSGGYWISMHGDEVFADPFTITGSIGVVYAKPVIQRLYEKIGVTNEVYKVGEHADALSLRRMMTEEEREYLGEIIDGMYEHFIEQVAEGRNMDPDHVRDLAGGRVYFGTQALEINLVDRLGGLKDAIDYAATESGIGEDYRTVYFRAFPDIFFDLEDGGLSIMKRLRNLWPLSDDQLYESLTVIK
jgi:protease-4